MEKRPLSIPSHVMRSTAYWLRQFSIDWYMENPLRLHSTGVDNGGAPQLHPEFINYLRERGAWDGKPPKNPDPRLRTTRAFRRLRKVSPREFEVLYRIVALGDTLDSTAEWLTERAIRNGKPERYNRDSVVLILISAVDKVSQWR